MRPNDPLSSVLREQPFLLLDGAMATELEHRGCQLADSLWSAKVLQENPQLIEQVHYDYFQAGARCAITASYQASLPGFAARNISAIDAQALMRLSVTLAANARHRYLSEHPQAGPLLVAGSVGPYGAYLADGSEYRGDYQCSLRQYQDFHRPRIAALIEAGADLLACETLPSFDEIRALAELLNEYPRTTAWFSFTLKDAQHLSDGTPLSEVVAFIEAYPRIVAIGINCIALENTTDALRHLHALTPLPLVVYPNSGEHYDPVSKTWHHPPHGCATLSDYLPAWREAGARVIGGCCRTTPADIAALHRLQTASV
ncbi:homocysteine S-methyltransferase [Tatumella terrea]|uniref:homocysteine S-methyltransferase n=1 Tax=Tatumella terrea TaxID=419007 RepID=UPI0031DA427F